MTTDVLGWMTTTQSIDNWYIAVVVHTVKVKPLSYETKTFVLISEVSFIF